MLWLLVASTMSEPPYVSSLRVEIPDDVIINDELQRRLQSKPGIEQVMIVAEERSAYIKLTAK